MNLPFCRDSLPNRRVCQPIMPLAAGVLLIGLIATAASAHEPGAHVHGLMTLKAAVDGTNLVVEMESPMDTLVGYEHAPSTPAQRDALRVAVAALRKPSGILVPSPAAECVLQKVTLSSSALEPKLLGEASAAGRANAPSEEPAGHADVDGEFQWQCRRPEKLNSLKAELFLAFPRLHQVKVEIAAPNGQAARTLTPNQPTAKW